MSSLLVAAARPGPVAQRALERAVGGHLLFPDVLQVQVGVDERGPVVVHVRPLVLQVHVGRDVSLLRVDALLGRRLAAAADELEQDGVVPVQPLGQAAEERGVANVRGRDQVDGRAGVVGERRDGRLELPAAVAVGHVPDERLGRRPGRRGGGGGGQHQQHDREGGDAHGGPAYHATRRQGMSFDRRLTRRHEDTKGRREGPCLSFFAPSCETNDHWPCHGHTSTPCVMTVVRMTRRLTSFIALPILTLTLAAAPSTRPTTAAAVTLATVDPAVADPPFAGWGVSLCWWAKVAGGYPEPARTRIMDQVFDAKLGLGLNVVRYNIGGGENPAEHSLRFRTAVPGYEPSPGRWDWSADADQRWVLAAAIRRGADHVQAFSNSPPWWMTRTGSVTGGADGAENLKPDAFEPFADYLATVVAHFRQTWGVTFETIDPLNEPSSAWWHHGNWQEGCRFRPPGPGPHHRPARQSPPRPPPAHHDRRVRREQPGRRRRVLPHPVRPGPGVRHPDRHPQLRRHPPHGPGRAGPRHRPGPVGERVRRRRPDRHRHGRPDRRRPPRPAPLGLGRLAGGRRQRRLGASSAAPSATSTTPAGGRTRSTSSWPISAATSAPAAGWSPSAGTATPSPPWTTRPRRWRSSP